MVSPFSARVLSIDDSTVLDRQIARLGAPAERAAAIREHLPGFPVLLEEVAAVAADQVAAAMRQLGGEAVVGLDAGSLLLVGNQAQFVALGRRFGVGEPALAVGAALKVVAAYRADRGVTRIGGRDFRWGERTYVMSIVNVTPDSFSGDGLGENVDAALAQAEQQVADGADLVDVGGESTRPRSERIDEAEELRRVLPVVERLSRALPVPVSVDTYRASVAERSLDVGVAMVNDIWGLRADPSMAALVARYRVPVVLMHNQRGIEYADLLGDVIGALRASVAIAREAGISDDRLIVDPGIGFGKSKEQNLELMHRLAELKVLGRPLLLGSSRKSTIGLVLNLPAHERIEGTSATVALGIAQGVDLVRVHDVREQVRVCRMADAVVRWRPAGLEQQTWPGQTG